MLPRRSIRELLGRDAHIRTYAHCKIALPNPNSSPIEKEAPFELSRVQEIPNTCMEQVFHQQGSTPGGYELRVLSSVGCEEDQ